MAGSRRIRREKRTVRVMLDMYCRKNHAHKKGLCRDCLELREYAHARLDRCPFIDDKPTCAKCPVHCYERGHRERMRAVMGYSGPRMILRHPVLTVLHMTDGFKGRGAPEATRATEPKPDRPSR